MSPASRKQQKSLTANMETDQLEDLKRTLADAFSYRGPYTKTTELSPLLSDIHMEDFKNAFSSTTSKKPCYQSPTESDRLVWRTKEGEFEITKVMLGIWARYIHLNMHGTTLLSPPNTRQFSLDNLKKVKKQPLNDSNSNQGLADAVKELAAQLLLRPANTIALSAPEHSLKTIPVASTPPNHFEWIFGICKEECITVETLEDSLAAELVAV
ncbi:hypothetical protein DFJ73DRAFT_769235 [Zopfochytrium polystomum]|nr:hypothetical protein DFJ73DRAFT_769235 [Zopfochytrium polystomum]